MSLDQNKVYILHEGYSCNDTANPAVIRANGTCTLIRTHRGQNIIVDTMTAWDGQRIIDALKTHDLQPSDINIVVCTHGHADHIGCNNLFTNAEWHIVGACVHKEDKFLDWNFNDTPFQLDGADVQVVATPGHTLSCVSVLIRNTNLGPDVGVCGDLFERMEDIEDSKIWIEAGSENQQAQRKNRLIIAERCKYIVPGHGAGFKMTEAMRVKLWQDTQQDNDAAQKQYNTLVDILAEHKVLLDRIVTQNAVAKNIMGIFPINTEEKLKEFDAILATHADPYIRQIKVLLGGNAERNLLQIFGHDIIMNFNVDGTFGKKRLRDYGNVFKALKMLYQLSVNLLTKH